MRKLFYATLLFTLFSCGKPTICDCNRAMVESVDGNTFHYSLIREDCLDQFGKMNMNEFDEAWKSECQ